MAVIVISKNVQAILASNKNGSTGSLPTEKGEKIQIKICEGFNRDIKSEEGQLTITLTPKK